MGTLIAPEIGRHHLDAAIARLPDRVTTDRLVARYVRPDNLRLGRHAAKIETEERSIHIWAVIGHLRAGEGTAQATRDYGLPEDAVVAAIAFYARHRPYIDAFLLLNEDDDDWESGVDGRETTS